MIVVDTNVIAYIYIGGPDTQLRRDASSVLLRDAEWSAPLLWRSEFCNVIVQHVHTGQMEIADADGCWREASSHLKPREHEVDATSVIHLAVRSGCTAYDCEFVVLAQALNVPLVTADEQVLKAFPNTAISLADFAKGKK